ncbi:PREDICTED: delta(14)-sterol reductase-like [Priapulus caudatus]|uniref:Delta(14)-sterol reductase-like n=1 Tax=Priapulus caudatus TaxID=37621 RepID=A0ABM1ESY1_PRICU|nr:PREDICTED: delta(14)-sterol reductase-like [Priapulus caudatus]
MPKSPGNALARQVGEHVRVYIPDTDVWVDGKVLDNHAKYTVELKTGKTIIAPGRQVTKPSRSQSKSPARSRSRSRSRGRGKSPPRTAKTKSATTSPARRSRSTSRSRTTTIPMTSTPAKKTTLSETKTYKIDKEVKDEVRSLGPDTPTRTSARLAAMASTNKQQPESMTADIKQMPRSEKVRKTMQKEFGGAFGALTTMLMLPATVILLYFTCTKGKCVFFKRPELPLQLHAYFNWQATAAYMGWFVAQVLLALLPIGRIVQGQPLRSGNRLSYRLNGGLAFVVSLASLVVAQMYLKYPIAAFVYRNYMQLACTAMVFSTLMSVILYLKARRAANNALNPYGNSGSHIYDFFLGHELNPRIRSFDLKFFCELRPGLIGWVVINMCMVAKDCQDNGSPSYPLLLVVGCQFLYVFDALFHEESVLTTFDITQEGFGWMLAFGDLVWVPFVYSLQARYLLDHRSSVHVHNYALVAILLLNMIGFWIFRLANKEKDTFRKNPHHPSISHLKSIATPSGKRLLISGWWGFVRKPNYLGDLLMAVAWSLPCGFRHLPPWFYPIYFAVLLVHRAIRDEHACRQKYGDAWDRYCEKVKYRIVPYVF